MLHRGRNPGVSSGVSCRWTSAPCSRRVWRNDPFLEDEAAVEAAFAGLNDTVGFFREFIECKSLDRAHRKGPPLGGIDLPLHLDLDWRNLVGLANDLHPECGLVDKGIQRQDRQNRARCAKSRNVINAKQPPQHGLASDRIRREIRIAKDDVITMAHGMQSAENVRIQNWINRFKHAAAPLHSLDFLGRSIADFIDAAPSLPSIGHRSGPQPARSARKGLAIATRHRALMVPCPDHNPRPPVRSSRELRTQPTSAAPRRQRRIRRAAAARLMLRTAW